MIQPWTTESSTTLVADEWLTLRADTCRTEEGRVVEPYYVIEAPTWVSVLALTPDRRAVLVDEYRHGAGVVGLGLPGGVMDPEDPSPMDAAARELREETGYVPGQIVEVGRGWANWASHSNEVVYFLATDCVRVGEPDDGEELEVVLHDLDAVLRGGMLQQSFHQANLHLALERMRA
jgi:8-oxo-dGTP pyrophosphatase MutT (NUDIX family)